jgi:isopentenyl-diphosphate delta-isomerase
VADRSQVLLADATGRVVGTSEKLAAHRAPGLLHLAFSVFLFDGEGRTLVQQRARSKYHFPGIWANACCSHPEPGEETDLAGSARRRLRDELGLEWTGPLTDVGAFVYRAADAATGLVEHESDHVLVGTLERRAPVLEPVPDPSEVAAWRWVEVSEVVGLGEKQGYAPWFAEALDIALRADAPEISSACAARPRAEPGSPSTGP